MRHSTILPWVALALLAACARPDNRPPLADRADSAGIEVVTNRGPDQPLALTFTPRLTLGGKDEGPESFFRVVHGSVAIDGSGTIHVLDFEAKTIAVFDSSGKFIRILGGPGDGPGELGFPNTVRTTDDGVVSVFDFSKGAVVRWGPKGSVLPSTRIKEATPPQDIAFAADGIVYSSTSFANEANVERTVLQLERADSVETLAGVERPPPSLLEFKGGCDIKIGLPPLFTPDIAWETNGRRIAWASKVGYEIAVRDSGGRRSLIRRDVAPREATLDVARLEVGDSMRVRAGTVRCAVGPEEVARVRGFAPLIPAIRTVMVAPDGSLWVHRTTPPADPAVIDLFTVAGDYRGTLPAGSPVPLAFFPNGDIAAVEKDKESEVEKLVVYRVGGDASGRRGGR